MADAELPDKEKLHAQTLAAWEAAQAADSKEFEPATVSQIARRGPFHSEQLIAEYLVATQGNDWVVKRDSESGELYVLAPQVQS